MLTRTLFLVYGVASYLLFLATFFYAIAFVGGIGVPRALDGAPTTPLATALAIDLALLGVFAVSVGAAALAGSIAGRFAR